MYASIYMRALLSGVAAADSRLVFIRLLAIARAFGLLDMTTGPVLYAILFSSVAAPTSLICTKHNIYKWS